MRVVGIVLGLALLVGCSDEPVCDGPSGSCFGGYLPSRPTEMDAGIVDASDVGDATPPARATPPCQADSPAGMNGAHIHVEGDRCTIPYGQGATFRYRVTLDRSIPYQVAAGSSCGFCSKLGSDVKPLTRVTVFAAGGGGSGLSYCADCDVGCCPPNKAASYELGAQTLEGVLDWPGRTYNGPSDTGQTPGDFFARGQAYVLITVTVPGMLDPIATAKLPIAIE